MSSHPPVIAIDFETFYIKRTPKNPGYSVQNMGNWAYCNDARFDAYMVSAYNGAEALACAPEDFNWDCCNGAILVSHNSAFDQAVFRRLVELGKVPNIKPLAWHCTANMTSYLCNRRSLANASKHLLKIKVSKSERDAMNGKQWREVVRDDPKLAEALTEYAKGDVIYCWRLWNEFSDQWPEHEREISRLTIEQGVRGIRVDTDLLEAGIKLTKRAIWLLEKDLPWMEAGMAPTSTKGIAEECRKVGIPSPPVKAHEGEEAFLEWERTYAPKHPWVTGVGHYRSLNKVLSTLETIQLRLKPDKTIDFSLLYFGAHSGRWSGGGAGLNMQNLRKEPLSFDKEGKFVPSPEPDVEYQSLNMRHLFRARDGYKFIICDAAQIEPRILHWLAGNTKLLEKIAQGYSFYEGFAASFVGWEGRPGTLKKEFGIEKYTLLKAVALGAGFGMGAARFSEYANVSMEEAIKSIEDFRAKNPHVTKLWSTLDRAFKRSARGTCELELPSGRSMRYDRVLAETRHKKDAEGKLVPKTVMTCDIGGRRWPMWGGDLTENIVQATARDVFAYHLLELEKAGLPVLFHVHDEVIVEVPLDVSPDRVVEVMSQTPPWLPGCPLAAEAQESPHYKK